jgi:hypothetical protein
MSKKKRKEYKIEAEQIAPRRWQFRIYMTHDYHVSVISADSYCSAQDAIDDATIFIRRIRESA